MRSFVAVLLACLVVLGGSPAHAAKQLDADDPPAVEGPFYSQPDQECDEQTLRSDGKPVIDVAFCIFFFAFDWLSELDVNHDYGVVWAQATFDALPGYCTSEVSFYVEMSEDTLVYQRTPRKSVTTRRTIPLTLNVRAAAGGTALQEGRISQEFQLLPGRMTPTGSEEQPKVGVAWKGRTPKKLAFATGAEISWPFLAAPPQIRLGADTIRLTSGRGC